MLFPSLLRDHQRCHLWSRSQLHRHTTDSFCSQRQVPSRQIMLAALEFWEIWICLCLTPFQRKWKPRVKEMTFYVYHYLINRKLTKCSFWCGFCQFFLGSRTIVSFLSLGLHSLSSGMWSLQPEIKTTRPRVGGHSERPLWKQPTKRAHCIPECWRQECRRTLFCVWKADILLPSLPGMLALCNTRACPVIPALTVHLHSWRSSKFLFLNYVA